MKDANDAGRWLRELRELSGLSQTSVANQLEVHQTAISQWESGRTKPNIELLSRLSKLYGVSIDTLIGNGTDSAKTSDVMELIKLREALKRTPELKMLLLYILSMDSDNIKRAIKVMQAMTGDVD